MTVLCGEKKGLIEKALSVFLILYGLATPISLSATYITMGCITLLGLLSLYYHRKVHLNPQIKILISFCILFLWYAISSVLSGTFVPEKSLRGMKELSLIVLLPLFMSGTRIKKERIIMAVLISSSLICLLGIIQFIFPAIVYPFPRQLIHHDDGGAFYGTFHNRLFAGGFYSITVILAFALALFCKTTTAKKGFLWAMLAIMWTALLLTQSRSYYISVLLVFIILLIMRGWKWAMSGILILMVIFTIIMSFPNPINTKIKSLTDKNFCTNNGRIHIWDIALDMIKKHPLTGIGKGNWEKHVREVYYPYFGKGWVVDQGVFAHAHNIYLFILAETGIIGFLSFLLFWGCVVHRLLIIRKKLDRASFAYAFNIGALSSIINLFVAGMFEYMFSTLVILLLFSFVIGLSLDACREPQ